MDFKVLRGTMKKNLLVQLRAYPISFLTGNLLDGFFIAFNAWMLDRYLFQGHLSDRFIYSAGISDYISYAVTGSLVYLFTVRTCLNVSRTLITELRQGTLESLMLAPFSRTEYFFASMLVQTVTTTMEILLSVIISIPFGADYSQINLIGFFAAMGASLYSFFSISLILGSIMLYTRDTYLTQNTLFAILFLICGITFPTDFLPIWLKQVSDAIPVTYAVTLIRNSILHNSGVWEQSALLIRTVIVSTMYTAIGFFLMKQTEKAALEKIHG